MSIGAVNCPLKVGRFSGQYLFKLEGQSVLAAPPRLEFGWREIAQRGMNPLVHMHIIQA